MSRGYKQMRGVEPASESERTQSRETTTQLNEYKAQVGCMRLSCDSTDFPAKSKVHVRDPSRTGSLAHLIWRGVCPCDIKAARSRPGPKYLASESERTARRITT